jgi:phosphate/sulfate permease
MSQGICHDVGVMIKSISTLDWQNEHVRNLQLRRVSLPRTLKRRFPSHRSSFEDDRILTRIDFGPGVSKKSLFNNPLSPGQKFHKSRASDEMNHEPLWVSVLGGIGLFLGLVTIWILA